MTFFPILNQTQLKRLLSTSPVDEQTMTIARSIVDTVRTGGEEALIAESVRLGDLATADTKLVYDRRDLENALEQLESKSRGVLERTAANIRAFAEAQRASLQDLKLAVPGGFVGHRVVPVRRAACYAPGGRYPLPSSVLMTAATAKAAGVEEVWVVSPKPNVVTLAAAAIAGADALLAVGGAQAIAAVAYGAGPVPACDVVVGPGNRFVTAAKALVSTAVRIDMLAGPSELLVIADKNANAAVIAADLLAQAEHDPDALTLLVTPSAVLIDGVRQELSAQLEALPTREVAKEALKNGGAVLVDDLAEAAKVSNMFAPEHLQVLVAEPDLVTASLTRYGGLFVGESSAEVFGDYGVGPNHTLPTGRTAAYRGGLSVLDFVAVRTWMDLADPSAYIADTTALARLEGLEGHARAAERRLP